MLKPICICIAAPILFASCGAVDTVKSATANATKRVSQFSINDLRPSSVDVVEVREKDLKEMPLGKERALAYERKRSFWSYVLPGDFKEPTLPDIEEGNMDGSLLPPKS
ncbi:MAG: hypothetical protein ACSHX9_02235 [Luteolibacter sp.]